MTSAIVAESAARPYPRGAIAASGRWSSERLVTSFPGDNAFEMTGSSGSGAQSPTWFQRRSAVFALVFAIGFFGGWAVSFATLGRYEPAFVTVGSHLGMAGTAIAACMALIVIAMALRVWGSSYLSALTVWDEAVHTDALVIAGPFRFVRHPLYLGNVLLAIGFGAMAPLFGWIFIVVADAIFIRSLIVFEDAQLAARYGDEFQAYQRAVPAMFPRPIPVASRQAVRPSLKQGLSAESFTMFVLAGVISLIVVPRFGLLLLILFYAAGVFVQRRIEAQSDEPHG